jgi:hypothetical protein
MITATCTDSGKPERIKKLSSVFSGGVQKEMTSVKQNWNEDKICCACRRRGFPGQ